MLLFVFLDDVRGPHLSLVRIFPDGAQCSPLTQEIPGLVEFDLEPFYETARLLYEGPWVAERYLVIRNLLASSPDAIHPVTREITLAGKPPRCACSRMISSLGAR